MNDFVTQKQLAEHTNTERDTQDDARHAQTEVFNVRFLQMEEKLDRIIDAVAGIHVDLAEIKTNMTNRDKKLEEVEKILDKKADMAYVLGAIAAACVAFVVIWQQIQGLQSQVNNLPAQIIQSLEQTNHITQ